MCFHIAIFLSHIIRCFSAFHPPFKLLWLLTATIKAFHLCWWDLRSKYPLWTLNQMFVFNTSVNLQLWPSPWQWPRANFSTNNSGQRPEPLDSLTSPRKWVTFDGDNCLVFIVFIQRKSRWGYSSFFHYAPSWRDEGRCLQAGRHIEGQEREMSRRQMHA